jgi:uncharacterized metal-binding protein YceD (DUF177 family)
MTPDSVGPLSRPFSVQHLPAHGSQVTVEATPEERAALARDLDLVSIDRFTAELHVSGTPSRVRVTGRVEAALVQTCVVTLEPFESELSEEVDASFRTPEPGETEFDPGPEHEVDLDAPEELLSDRIDLGAIAAEFLALGLDPYPKKPGVEFQAETGEGETGPADKEAGSPFAALAKLRKDQG